MDRAPRKVGILRNPTIFLPESGASLLRAGYTNFMSSIVNKKCMECQQQFPGNTMICPHDGSNLATTLARSPAGLKLANRYELTDEIGRGGMGVIYKAIDSKAANPKKNIVAIKLLLNDAGGNETVRTRFMIEARAASSLNHPNIIKVHEFDVSEDGLPFMVMEYLDGVPLDALMEVGDMDTAELLGYGIEVCDALSHAHRRNIIHRDVKPSNIMIVSGEDGKGKAIVVDFGIAKIFAQPGQTSLRLTQTGEVFGSPLYMSPEQCMGQALDHRSDIYAFGCLLYECLSGESPFRGENFLNVIFQHIHEAAKPFAKHKHDHIIEPIVLKALEKKPEDRYQNMVELRQALEHCHRLLTGGSAGTKSDTTGEHSIPRSDEDILKDVIKEAESGDPNAQYDLGLYYQYGHFMDEPNEELGFEWCLKAAKQGLVSAQLAVGDMFHYEWGVKKDLTQAIYWYEAAAGQDNADAMSALGVMYEWGEGVEADSIKALKWNLGAAELENGPAQMALGYKYAVGGGGVERDDELSLKWFLRAADQGNAEAQVQAGIMYKFGTGTEADGVKAAQWFRAAADQGYADAQCELALCYDEGCGVLRNGYEAVKWMTEAMRNGDAQAHTWLGFWTFYGENGLMADEKKGISYYREAAELGQMQARYYLGDCYLNGTGVARNEKTAVHWFKPAAAEGNAGAQVRLATCYLKGIGGLEPDEKMFLKWMRKAAEQNDLEALYELGMHYKSKRKFNNATKWLKLALEREHPKAQKALNAIEKERSKND